MFAQLGWVEVLASPGDRRKLGLSGFIDAAGTGLAALILPFYVVQILDYSPRQLALILGLGGVAELACTPAAGVVASRVGLKNYFLVTRLGRAAVFALLPLAGSLWAVALLAGAEGALRAANPGLSQALAVSVLGADERIRALAAIRALRNLGYLVGAGGAAASLAVDTRWSLTGGLWLNSVSFVLVCLILLTLNVPHSDQALSSARWSVLVDYSYLSLIPCAAVFAMSTIVLDVAIPLWVIRHDWMPKWSVGAVVAVNTLLVVVFQVKVAAGATTIGRSVTRLRLAAALFVGAGLLVSFSAHTGRWPAVSLLLLGAVLLTFGEMSESSAWWVISYENAPENYLNEYLATFDLSRSAMNIAGPLVAVWIVGAGTAGWLTFGMGSVVAALAANWLTRPGARGPSGPTDRHALVEGNHQ